MSRQSILEDIRRKAWDAIKDDVETNRLKIISNSVEMFRDKGLRMAIILILPEEEDER